jgi:hypothetical protein
MGLIREPKKVDLIVKSEPWTEKELADFRELMSQTKNKLTHRTGRKNKHLA